MKLRETILKEHSKANCLRIVRWVGKNQERFDQLFQLFISDEYRVVQRAAWPVSYCVETYPFLVQNHFSKLIRNLQKKDMHVAVRRNSLRMFQYMEIPIKYHGLIIDLCFRYISSPDEAIAVKAFSLNVLYKLSQLYPEIKNELKLVVGERINYETPAYRSCAKKILKDIG